MTDHLYAVAVGFVGTCVVLRARYLVRLIGWRGIVREVTRR